MWRKSKLLLQIEGEKVGYVIQRLCAKILSEYSNSENLNSLDVLCQTVADFVCMCRCWVGVKELKASRAADREIIISLSDTVAQIAGFIKQFEEENWSSKNNTQ